MKKKSKKGAERVLYFIYLILSLLFIVLLVQFIYATIYSRGIVSITFDDGYENFYSIAYPVMKDYNFTGTVFIIANWSGDFEWRKLMNFSQARELQDKGWEIGSHTLNHKRLTNISEKEVIFELEESKKLLEKNGFKIKGLSLPFGDYNKNIIDVAKKNYSYVRLMVAGHNNFDLLDFYHLKSNQIMLNDTPQIICNIIKKSNEEKKWLIINFHYIDYKEDRVWDASLDDFKGILDCINKSNVNVMNIGDVVEMYEK